MKIFLFAIVLATSAAAPAAGADLPAGFVRLADVAPSIRQDMRYAGPYNFLGRPAKGYEDGACILTARAADALKTVQDGLREQGVGLVVFDCYRPASAVADFVEWAERGGGADARWHPSVRRRHLVRDGYIGAKSGHSRGSAVDIGLAPLEDETPRQVACGADRAVTLDFGTGFDCFDPASHTASPTASKEARKNRKMLVDAMRAAGFRNYAREWWHFTLADEPFRKAFDFPVTK